MLPLRKIIILLIVFIAINSGINAQQTPQKFVQELRYLLYLPDNYTTDTTAKWPLMLFLHGSGESGMDLEKVKTHGPPKLIEAGKKFPMIVVSPQATNGWKADQLMALVNDLKSKYRIDNERLYLTGLSMGGFGSWALATEYPGEFAAVAPICGGGDTSKAWTLRNTPIWDFHGQMDPVVPIQSSIEMVDAVKKVNPSIKFTIYPEAGHDSWTETYNNPALYEWLLAQKKFHYSQASLPHILERYTGNFVSAYKDTITVQVASMGLQLKGRNGRLQTLKYVKPDLFYFDERSQDDVHFLLNKKGIPEAMEIWGRRKTKYVKVK